MMRRNDGLSFWERQLHAYHDGELSGLARWRFERALRRSPGLRQQLEGLAQLSGGLRAHDASQPAPDLWDAIAERLPAVDARRGGAEPASPGRWWLKPVGALVATAAIAALVLWAGPGREAPDTGAVVRWIDTGERGVLVLDDRADTTIIWVLDAASEGSQERSGRERV